VNTAGEAVGQLAVVNELSSFETRSLFWVIRALVEPTGGQAMYAVIRKRRFPEHDRFCEALRPAWISNPSDKLKRANGIKTGDTKDSIGATEGELVASADA
jgi:hypothetical protein